MTDNKQYPELPTHFMLVQESFRDEVYLYTADQMRAYVDADRAMRAARDAEDAAHIKNLCELVRMPNAEYVADAHNAAVKYLRLRARAQPTPPAVVEPFTAAQRGRMFRNRPSDVGKGLSLADWHRVVQYVEACHGIKPKEQA